MANVFLPQTIDASFAHKNDGSEQVPGLSLIALLRQAHQFYGIIMAIILDL